MRLMGVYVDLAYVFSVFEQGYYDLGSDIHTAGNVVVLHSHIGDHKVFLGFGYLSADAFAKGDYGVVCTGSGVGAQVQLGLITGVKIEPYPIVMRYIVPQEMTHLR